jgi:hypothetical protein
VIGRFFRRLFGPPPPEDRREWNEDWRVGDLAECINGSWLNDPPHSPQPPSIYRVREIDEGVTADGSAIIVALNLEGLSDWWGCTGFRKLRPTIEAADAAFTADLRDCLRTPAKHTA